MLTKVLHREKGSRKLLAEFPNKAFKLIPAVFIVLETCVFSVIYCAFYSILFRGRFFPDTVYSQ